MFSLRPTAIGLFVLTAQLFVQPRGIDPNSHWLPVTEAELKMSQPLVDKDAGVEALFWRVYVSDEFKSPDVERTLYHYIRLKVFTDKGKETAATIEIPYGDRTGIAHLSARTIKPDGKVLEVDGRAVHDRDLIRAGRIRRRAKTFAMPGVEPGAIVEYRYKEIRTNPRLLYNRLQLQQEFPVQKVTYFVRPIPGDYTAYRMSLWPFNCEPTRLKLENDGWNSTTLEKVPAFQEEPMMPGEANLRAWALLVYREDGKREPEKYWDSIGKKVYRELKDSLKLSDEMKAAATKAVADTKNEDEKVLALIRYIRANLRSLFDPRVTEAERAKVIKSMPESRHRTSAEVFKTGIGTPDELNTLFAAMAMHVGLDARPILVADRNGLAFDPQLADIYFLPNIDMAVKIGEEWKVYDVSTRLLPPDMIGWQEEGVFALISDPKKPSFIQTRLSAPEASTTHRQSKLVLEEDGTLEGSVDEYFTGHAAAEERVALDRESEARREEFLKDNLARQYPQAEITNIKVENVENTEQPLILKYRVRIPGYAQRTGKRLFFQPVVHQRGRPALFASNDRRQNIDFQHAWTEQDQVTIKVPAGFALDNAENPGSLQFGKPGAYDLQMTFNPATNELHCLRKLVFGKEGMLLYPASAYKQLKTVFDEVHRRDNHTLSLRQAGAGAVSQ